MNAKDEFLIFTETECRRAFNYDGAIKAMEDLGRNAQVRRITDGELSRIVTHNFMTIEADEYLEIEDYARAHTRHMSSLNAFGKRL